MLECARTDGFERPIGGRYGRPKSGAIGDSDRITIGDTTADSRATDRPAQPERESGCQREPGAVANGNSGGE